MTGTRFPVPSAEIGMLATLAAVLEASAPKPGNVSPGRPFRDMRYEDFVASAVASGPEFGCAAQRPLGETILAAVTATRRRTDANTNLGIILLFAPLARAAGGATSRAALRARVREVLAATTIADAGTAYAAIRAAQPGGLGASREQDLSGAPTVTFREAMGLAAERDSVASEYASDFTITFEMGAPALRRARAEGLTWPEATVECFLTLLAARPDTLITRKLGAETAVAISRDAAAVLRQGGVRTVEGQTGIAAFDSSLRDGQNSRNPGTTADLTAAALYLLLLEDGWQADRLRNSRAQ